MRVHTTRLSWCPQKACSVRQDYMWTLGSNDVMLFCCPYLLQSALELTGRKIMPTSHVRKYAIIPSNADCIFSVEHLGNSLWLTVFSCWMKSSKIMVFSKIAGSSPLSEAYLSSAWAILLNNSSAFGSCPLLGKQPPWSWVGRAFRSTRLDVKKGKIQLK